MRNISKKARNSRKVKIQFNAMNVDRTNENFKQNEENKKNR